MRTFRDSNGEDWTVFEVRRQTSADGTTSDMSYLPGGYSSGWLCFENHARKKRLVQYPARWREFSDAELERLLTDATPAPRASLRLTDLGESSHGSDAQPK